MWDGGAGDPRPVRGIGAERASAVRSGGALRCGVPGGRESLAGTPGPGGFHGGHTYHLVSPPHSAGVAEAFPLLSGEEVAVVFFCAVIAEPTAPLSCAGF